MGTAQARVLNASLANVPKELVQLVVARQHGPLVDALLGEHPFPRPVWAQDVAVLTCSGEHFALGDAVNLQMPHPRSAPAPGRYSGRTGGRRDDEALATYEPRRRRHLPRIASGNYPLPDGPLL